MHNPRSRREYFRSAASGTEGAVRVLFQALETCSAAGGKTDSRADAEILVSAIGRVSNSDALKLLQETARSADGGHLSAGTAARNALRNFPDWN